MPHHKSAAKRLRTSGLRRLRNRQVKSSLKTAVRRLREAESPEEARNQLRKVESMLDKAAKKRVFHANTAARRKARLVRFVARYEADPEAVREAQRKAAARRSRGRRR